MSETFCKAIAGYLKDYGLAGGHATYMKSGAYCSVYEVQTAGARYVARLRSPEAKDEDVRFAIVWSEAVSAEVPVSIHLPCSADRIPRIDHRCLDVATYVEHDDSSDLSNAEGWTKVGNWVGKMHRLGDRISSDAPVALDYGNHPHRQLLTRYFQQARVGVPREHTALMHRVERLFEHTEEALEPLSDLPVGVVHGDMHFWNVLYRAGEPAAIIDFDFLQKGVLALDLAYAGIWLTTWERERGGPWSGVRDRYLAAYQDGRGKSLTDAETAALPWLQVRIHLMFFLDQVRSSWRRLPKAMEDLNSAEDILAKLDG